jgi:16S rRNA (cytosine1402-N4)-methyltransferase
MTEQVMAALAPRAGALLLDGTVGLGGHARAWLERTAPGGRVIGLDRDASALESARRALSGFGERASLAHADYRDAEEVLERLGAEVLDAVLLDLGLGSHQLDDPRRGFSFRLDGPLDMRFDSQGPGETAADLLARTSEPELTRIFGEWGEIRAARKLARAVVETRRRAPLRTTGELAELARSVLPAGRKARIDPATLVFQALRIAVNAELEGLGAALETLVTRLVPGGRIAVISFHSLEDRVVKTTMRRLAEPCRCRRGDPCSCGAVEVLELGTRKPQRPDERETDLNPRARSARLRWGIRR